MSAKTMSPEELVATDREIDAAGDKLDGLKRRIINGEVPSAEVPALNAQLDELQRAIDGLATRLRAEIDRRKGGAS